MAKLFNIAEAKAKLSELIARAEAGEEIIIARAGAPAVRLTPAGAPNAGRRQFGGCPGWTPLLELDWSPAPEHAAAADKPIDWAAFDDPTNRTAWPDGLPRPATPSDETP